MNLLAQSVEALLRRDGGAAEVPFERKPPIFQSPKVAPVPVPQDAEYALEQLAKARRLVKKPAIALLVIGIPCLALGLPVAVLNLAEWLLITRMNLSHEPGALSVIYGSLAVTGSVVVSAGLSMIQLRRYWLCMVGSIVVMLLWVTIPIGIWSLWALRRPGIRSAFRLNEALGQEDSIADLGRV